ncbi:MAG: putative phosphodiesterase [Gammaproteobacteria bacterium]
MTWSRDNLTAPITLCFRPKFLKIQFFSDIHLEFGGFDLPTTDADVIVAAGDIGVGLQGVDWLDQLGKPVVYVAGNHEYYSGDIVHTRVAIAEKSRSTQISFLENEVLEIDGVRFLGATLWTDFLGGNERVMHYATQNMNDYQQIRCASRPLTPAQLLDINWESRFWLAGELEKPFAGKTVVVSHHAPTARSWPGTGNRNYLSTYCNRLDDFLERYSIDAWFHGHLHNVVDYEQNATRVLCNPRGYTGYQTVDDFSPTKTIAI